MLRAIEALGKLLAHMHCPRPQLLVEEFPGFQLETVISVNPVCDVWIFAIPLIVQGLAPPKCTGGLPFTGRDVPGFLQQTFLTSSSSPAHTRRLSGRAGGRKSWSPQWSMENFPPAFAKSTPCLPRRRCCPLQCLGSMPAWPLTTTLAFR